MTPERLRKLLQHDPDTGVLTWAVARSSHVLAGDEAGYLHSSGYRFVGVDGGLYKAHRLIWLHVYGDWPKGELDHINGIRSDNRLNNLRDVSRSGNKQNRQSAQANNKSGLLGVSPNHFRWQATITTKGLRRSLGTFDTPEEAHAAYLAAKRSLHSTCTI